jgi:hypothetical protein
MTVHYGLREVHGTSLYTYIRDQQKEVKMHVDLKWLIVPVATPIESLAGQ